MKAYIKQINYYIPEKKLTNEDLVGIFPELNANKLFEKTGIKQRGISNISELSSDKAICAAELLFSEKKIKKSEIDFLIFCTQTPDYITPSTSCIIQDKLGLNKNIGALDVNLGCTGFLYVLSLAKGLIESGIANNVLLLNSESLTNLLHPKDKSSRILFGDAATATVISTREENGIEKFVFGTNGADKDIMIIKAGGFRQPSLKNGFFPEISDEFGNIHSDDYFFMNGTSVLSFSLDISQKLVKEILKINSFSEDQIDYYIFHQANGFILDVIRKKLKIPEEKFCIDLTNTGNTVSCTIPIALKNCIDDKKIKKGNRIMLITFGVGLSWAATTIIV